MIRIRLQIYIFFVLFPLPPGIFIVNLCYCQRKLMLLSTQAYVIVNASLCLADCQVMTDLCHNYDSLVVDVRLLAITRLL